MKKTTLALWVGVYELRSLIETEYGWVTRNDVGGLLFGIAPNQIFLPAASRRHGFNGTLSRHVGTVGGYWSSTLYNDYWGDNLRSMELMFNYEFGGFVQPNWRQYGSSIRCVSTQ